MRKALARGRGVSAWNCGTLQVNYPAMTDDARLIEIETRLAFQESALQELDELVNRQRLELESLRRVVGQAMADLLTLREGLSSGAANEPPPPHY